jgi:hypothetical protein
VAAGDKMRAAVLMRATPRIPSPTLGHGSCSFFSHARSP